jgi:rod shape-determining protein MreD
MLFLLVFGAVCQVVVPSVFFPGNARMPVLAGLVVYYALTRSLGTALRAAVLAGLLQDAMSLIPLGYSSFCFCLAAWLIYRVRDEVYIRSWITHALFGAMLSALTAAGLYLMLSQGGLLAVPLYRGLMKILSASLLGAVLTPLIFRGAEWLDRKLGITVQGDTV